MTRNHHIPGWLVFLLEILLIIGASELAVMLLLDGLNLQLPPVAASLADTLLLMLLCTPLLYWRVKARVVDGTSFGSDRFAASRRIALLGSTAIFLLGSGPGLTIAYQMHREMRVEASDRFARQVDLLEDDLKSRFEKAYLGLNSLSGFYYAQGGFNRPLFRSYWKARGFVKDFPGVRGFGVIEHVARRDVDRFLALQRRDHAPDFTIKTKGDAPDLHVITLVEPLEQNRQAVGLDIGFEPVRRAAAEQAIRTGQPTLSGVITLVQDGRQGPGFLLLEPLYRHDTTPATPADRLKQHIGFVYSPIVASELFSPMVPMALGLSTFEIYAAATADPAKLVFQSLGNHGLPPDGTTRDDRPHPAFVNSRTLEIADQLFTLRVSSTPAFEAVVDSKRPQLVGTGSVLVSALMALSLWLVASGRARAEARARQLTSELHRLATVAERTSNSVVIADENNHIVWVNRAFTQLSGYTLDEARGHLASELRGKAQDPDKLAAIWHALKNGENLRIETVNESRDGREYWVDLDLQILRDATGRYMGYVAVERDITEFRQAQERERANTERLNAALRETEALMDTINAHGIVSEAGRDGRITRVNEAFCRISGYSRDELIGQNHRIVNSGTHDRAFWVEMWKTISAGQPWRGQICNRAKDGALYWVDSIIAPFLDADGHIEKYVSIRFDITKARQTELDLAKERQRLQSTLEGTHVGTWEINVITGENRIDERWAEILGYRLDELLPMTREKWQDLLHPDDEKHSNQQLIEYLHARAPIFEVERRLRHRNGEWIWVLSRGTVSSRLPDGRVEWISGTHMDVTERHRLYEEIERRSNLMTAILDNMPGGLSAFDADLKMIAMNEQFTQLLDFPAELFDKPVVKFEDIIRFNAERGEYGPGDVDSLVGPIIERARHPSLHHFERLRPDGTVLEVRGAPMPGGGFVTTYVDITQRKQAEKEARQADEMLRQAIDTLDEAFVIYDDQDRLLMCNQRYLDSYPLSAEAIKPGNTFESIIRLGAERGEYAQAIGRVDEWVTERLQQHRRGDTDQAQELSNGQFIRVVERRTADNYTVGFRIDITDLVRARLAAESASQSKSQFLANMSHEIRTPMNAILGMLSLLQSSELNPRQLDYVQKTEGAAKSLLGLLNDILDFSKVEAGKMTLESAPFRIDHLMRDLSVILSANAGSKNIEVLFDLDRQLPSTLVGDSLRLKQILINLSGNAIKFTQQGMVLIRIEVLTLQPGRAMLEFSVRDTGIGIAPQEQARIFEGFSQAEASTTRRFGGTGLGLAISSRLVGLMGSQLELESQPGQGSRFHFRVTLDVPDDATPIIAPPVPPDVRQLQVLIIDDNPMAQQILQDMVQPMGWQAVVASSGEQALALIRERLAKPARPFDAIFVDWKMPGMDGWETSLQIRRLLGDAHAPILVMVTAYGREMLSRRPADEQALLNGFLVKPVTPSMLLDAIMEARHVAGKLPAPRATEAPATRRLQGMRVLLVEDNRINQEVAQELLRREGAQVTLADNGELGVQAIASARPAYDVVLMDVQMPVMDGYTATRKVRQELGFSDQAIIAMTANAMESDRQDALAAGMNAHVGKPFNLDELVATMLRVSGYVAPPSTGAAPATAVTPVAPSAAVPALPAAGAGPLDIPSALARLGGDRSILQRILQSFARDLPQQPQALADLLARGQTAEAQRLMHTLKGTAATVGATRLATLAAEAEARLRQDTPLESAPTQQLLARLRRTVDEASEALTQLLQQWQGIPPAPAAGQAMDPSALTSDLHELLALLRNSDLASLDVFARLQERHGNALGSNLDELEQALAGLDFARAIGLCEALNPNYSA